MDYTLLAATALGGVALYLMLPREKASLVKLGMLLAVLAFGGLFVYLLRGLSASGITPVDPYFYVFAAIMIAGTIGVICQPKPVYAALYFVLVTLAGAGLFVLLLAEFMAIVLIIIYAGAILVTYVFVIMLASQSSGAVGGEAAKSPLYDREAAEPLIATLVSFVLLGAILQCLYPSDARKPVDGPRHSDPHMVARINEATGESARVAETQTAIVNASTTAPATQPVRGDLQLLASSLYGNYGLSLELGGILLTIALVGAVVIARKEAPPPSLGSGQVPNE